MRRSFRLKLALAITVSPGLILLTGGIAAWRVVSHRMLEAVDARLTLPANALIRRASAPRAADFEQWAENFTHRESSPGMRLAWVVRMEPQTGEVTFESRPGLASALRLQEHLPPSPPPTGRRLGPRERPDPPRPGPRRRPQVAPLRRLETPPGRPGPPLFFTLETEDTPWRVAALSSPSGAVFAGLDLTPFLDEARQMRRLFLAAALAGLSLTALAGWFVADRAIRPVRRITATAETVAATGLHQRIPTSGTEDQEFARLIGVLNTMMERLERSYHHAVRFSADASHELKTPLTVMQGELERLLKTTSDSSSHQEAFLSLSQEVHRLHRITEALLLLSRADAGNLKLTLEPLNLTGTLEDFCEDTHILCEDKNLTFTCQIPPGLAISGHRDTLLLALHNLLSNALKYSHPDGRVSLVARNLTGEKMVEIEVANTGPPLTDTQRHHIFRRFYRGDAARTRQEEGFGLGLNIASELVKAHGGTLTLLSREAGDAENRFVIRIPAVSSPEGDDS